MWNKPADFAVGRHLASLAHPNSKSRDSEGLDTLWYRCPLIQ